MDAAFILPLPDSKRGPKTENLRKDLKKTTEFKSLVSSLEKLKAGKISWDDFFQVIDPSNPILQTLTTKSGDNILHLAVIANLASLPKDLAEDQRLLLKRNHHGFTPIEMACFLQRGSFSKWLRGSNGVSFLKMPGVVIEDLKESTPLNNLSFTPHPIFENEDILSDILHGSQKAKSADLIPLEKTWMGIYFDQEMQQGAHPPVSIRFIDPDVGFGVFSTQKIAPCSFVGEYTGIVQEKKSKHVKDKRYCVRYTVWEMGRRNFIIDAEKVGNFTRFINHSSNPNLSLQSVYWRGMPRMIFIALKEIQQGAQLTFDYGTFFWKECQQTPKLF